MVRILYETVCKIVELGGILDDDGVDIWFLNRTYNPVEKIHKPIEGITDMSVVMNWFVEAPTGSTPLTNVLRRVFLSRKGKPQLVLICTDGEPNDANGFSDVRGFTQLLNSRERDVKNNCVSILACTNDDKSVGWLNKLDNDIEYLDVIDDYDTEYMQIIKVQGENFSYTMGDHIIKMLLGPIYEHYDNLDEKKMKLDSNGRIIREIPIMNVSEESPDCCVIL